MLKDRSIVKIKEQDIRFLNRVSNWKEGITEAAQPLLLR